MRNVEIRRTAKESGVHLWEVAEALGIADATFSRRLRRELPEAEKGEILAIIAGLSGGDGLENEDNRAGGGMAESG